MMHFKLRDMYLKDIVDFYDVFNGYNVSLKVADIPMDVNHIADIINDSDNVIGSVSQVLEESGYSNEVQNLTTIDNYVDAERLYGRYSKAICLLLDRGYVVITGTNTGKYQYLTISKEDGQSTKTYLHLHITRE